MYEESSNVELKKELMDKIKMFTEISDEGYES